MWKGYVILQQFLFFNYKKQKMTALKAHVAQLVRALVL